MKMKAGIVTSVLVAGISFASQAQTLIAGWYDVNTATTSFPLSASAGSAISATESYSGLTPYDDSRNVWADANQASALDVATAPYVSWTINLGSASVTGAQFFLDGMAATDSSTKFQLGYSVDNYDSSLVNLSAINGNYQDFIASVPGTLTGTVTFNLFLYNTSSTYATHGYPNLFIAGLGSFYTAAAGTYNSAMGSYSAGLVGALPVPEPSTWAMLGMGAFGLLRLRRKK